MSSACVLLEPGFESRVCLGAASERRERLRELLSGERQVRIETNGVAESGGGLLEAPLHRQDSAEVFVQGREVRTQGQRAAKHLIRLVESRLHRQRTTEESQVIHGARTGSELLAADGFSAF